MDLIIPLLFSELVFPLQILGSSDDNFLDILVLKFEPGDPLGPQMGPKMDPARLVLGDAPGSPKVYICQFIDIETMEKLKFAVWFEGILPEIYTPRHGVTLKSKLFLYIDIR